MGSEMCIRDRLVANPRSSPACASWPARRLTALKRTRCNSGVLGQSQTRSARIKSASPVPVRLSGRLALDAHELDAGARRVASADFCARRLFPKCCWSQVSNPRLNLAHKNRGRSPGLAHYFFLGGGGAGCLMRSFSCVAGLRSASRLVVNTPLSESRYWVCVLVPLCLFGMISPFTRLEKQQIFRFTSISRLFGRGIVLVSTGRETCLFTPRGEKFVPGRLSSAASIPPTPCELSTATAVEPAAWSSRRHRLSSMALSADR